MNGRRMAEDIGIPKFAEQPAFIEGASGLAQSKHLFPFAQFQAEPGRFAHKTRFTFNAAENFETEMVPQYPGAVRQSDLQFPLGRPKRGLGPGRFKFHPGGIPILFDHRPGIVRAKLPSGRNAEPEYIRG